MLTDQVFQDIMEQNEQCVENLFVEPAIMIDQQQSVYYPGIHIEASRFNAPIFISVDQLREMADRAEQIAISQMQEH